MSKEELIKLCKDEFKNNVMENLDSALVFTYIKNLEENIKKLKQEKEELVEWLEEQIKLKKKTIEEFTFATEKYQKALSSRNILIEVLSKLKEN